MVRPLPSISSAAGCPALFGDFAGTTDLSDFPCPGSNRGTPYLFHLVPGLSSSLSRFQYTVEQALEHRQEVLGVVYQYDAYGRLNKITAPGLPGTYGVEYTYEADGDLIDTLKYKTGSGANDTAAMTDRTYEANGTLDSLGTRMRSQRVKGQRKPSTGEFVEVEGAEDATGGGPVEVVGRILRSAAGAPAGAER